MTAKSKLLYKIITIITLAVPLPIYLFLSATLFNIIPDYRIENIGIEDVLTVPYEEYTFMYTTNTEAVYDGVVVYRDGQYGFVVDEENIIQIDGDYYNYNLEDIKKLEIQKQTSYKLPISFAISLLGVGIVAMIISKKMQLYKTYPRASALVALITITVLLLIINTIVSNIFNVFLIATVSWALYCIEYAVNAGHISHAVADKQENDLISSLKEALSK